MQSLLCRTFLVAALSGLVIGCDKAEKPFDESEKVFDESVANGFYVIEQTPEQKALTRRFFDLSDRFEKLNESFGSTLDPSQPTEQLVENSHSQGGNPPVLPSKIKNQLDNAMKEAGGLLSKAAEKFKSDADMPEPCKRMQRVYGHKVDDDGLNALIYGERFDSVVTLSVRTGAYIMEIERYRVTTSFKDIEESTPLVDDAESKVGIFEKALLEFQAAVKPLLEKKKEETAAIRQKQLQLGLAVDDCRRTLN